MKLCDIHSHILPGVDDGCRSMGETLKTLEEACRQQIEAVVATPHFYPGRYQVPSSQVLEVLERVKRECGIRKIEIHLYAGHECFYYSGLVKELNNGNALTIAGTDYVLVEFEPNCSYCYLYQGLRNLRQDGYKPILAHFERYECLKSADNLAELKEQGIRLQMNYDTVILKGGFFRKQIWRQLISQGIVDYLASDCHGMKFRPLHGKEMQECLETFLGTAQIRRILQTNVRDILKNK